MRGAGVSELSLWQATALGAVLKGEPGQAELLVQGVLRQAAALWQSQVQGFMPCRRMSALQAESRPDYKLSVRQAARALGTAQQLSRSGAHV